MADGDPVIVQQGEAPDVAGKASSYYVMPRKESAVSLTPSTKSTLDLLPSDALEDGHVRSLPWNIGCNVWCRKYFWEDKLPAVDADLEAGSDCGSKVVQTHRRLIGVVLPVVVVHFVWWCVMVRWQLFYLFPDRYVLTITMVCASVIAGLTSIGGGAIAFPVLTLLLNVSPEVARDFALLIQSCGMTCATFTIFFMNVRVDWWAIFFCSLGGAVGLLVGLQHVEYLLAPAWKKMTFSSFWFSFAFALFFLNRFRKRKTFPCIPSITCWKVLVLVVTGVVGGLFTSFVGAGLDICSLSVLTLFFRVTEKTATPTSVVLMAFNSMIGAFWRGAIMVRVEQQAWEFLAVSSMVAVVGGPLGSILGTKLHRQVLAFIIYILVTVTLISSFVLVPQTPVLAGVSVVIILVGGLIFGGLTYLGEQLKASLDDTNSQREGSSSHSDSTYSVETISGSTIKDAESDFSAISHL